jgi:integrase
MAKKANGEGSVYRRKSDGRWSASITLPGGKRKHFLGKDRDEVVRKQRAALKSQDDGLPIIAERQMVGQFMQRWLTAAKPSLRGRTWERYEQYVRLHIVPGMGKVWLTNLTPLHLQRLYAQRIEAGLSTTTVHHLHATIHRALDHAVRWSLVQRNVADLVDPPRPRHHEITTLSAEEANRLLSAAHGNRLEALYVIALTTGMRQGELLGVRWRDVDLDRGAVQIRGTMQATKDGLRFAETKTRGSRRHVLLSARAVDALRRHRAAQAEERLRVGPAWEDNDLVFANEVGRPIAAGNLLKRSFEPLLTRAGVPRIRFHDLRHSAATLLLEQGIHPKIVSEMLGHTRISTTLDLYSHVTPTMQRQAAEAFDSILSSPSAR